MVPVAEVFGTGVVVLPVPPVDTVYHFNPVPFALKTVAVAFWQYVIGDVTVGAVRLVLTVTTIIALGPLGRITLIMALLYDLSGLLVNPRIREA